MISIWVYCFFYFPSHCCCEANIWSWNLASSIWVEWLREEGGGDDRPCQTAFSVIRIWPFWSGALNRLRSGITPFGAYWRHFYMFLLSSTGSENAPTALQYCFLAGPLIWVTIKFALTGLAPIEPIDGSDGTSSKIILIYRLTPPSLLGEKYLCYP